MFQTTCFDGLRARYRFCVLVIALGLAGLPHFEAFEPTAPSPAPAPPLERLPSLRIYNIRVQQYVNHACVTWETTAASDSHVDVGRLTYSNPDQRRAFFHGVSVWGLEPGTSYRFHVRSRDAHGNEADCGPLELTTNRSSPESPRGAASSSLPAVPPPPSTR